MLFDCRKKCPSKKNFYICFPIQLKIGLYLE